MGALSLAIIPLIILSVIDLRLVQNTVSEQSNESIRIATEITVNELDDFITSNLSSLEAEASLPAFLDYLNLAPDARPNSTEELQLKATIRSLQTKETVYSPSYALLNLLGVNVYDTNTNNVGKSELTTDYFQKSSQMKSSYASTVEFVPKTQEAFIYFISPIYDEDQNIIGYLRMNFSADILQNELEKTSGIIGSHSYPILLDENGIRLADASNPNLIYHAILPISNGLYTTLLNENRIPSYLTQSKISS